MHVFYRKFSSIMRNFGHVYQLPKLMKGPLCSSKQLKSPIWPKLRSSFLFFLFLLQTFHNWIKNYHSKKIELKTKKRKEKQNYYTHIWEHFFSCWPMFWMSFFETFRILDCSSTFSIRSFSSGTLERVLRDPTMINFFCITANVMGQQ